LDVLQLLATVRQRYRFVLGVALTTFALVMAVTLASRMKFRSVGRLYLGELEESSAANAARNSEIALSATNQGVIGSEVEIIQSRSLVSHAIVESGLNASIVAVGRDTPRYGAWLLSRRNPALLDRAAGEIRATDSALTDPYAKERSYQIRFKTDADYDVWSDEQRLGSGKLGETTQVPGARLTLLAASEGSVKAGARYDVTLRPLQQITDATLDALTVSAPKPLPPAQPVNVVTLEFVAQSPRIAARFLDSLMAGYLNARQSWKAEDATAAETFVTNQLTKTRETLDDLQKRLADYRSNNRVVVMDNEAKAMIEQIGKYEEQRVAARLEVAALSELQRTLKAPNPPVTAFLLGEANDSVIERMASSLSDARQKLTDLETRFNEAAPELKGQREQVDAQLQAIRNYVASRASRAQENLNTLDGIIKQFETKLNTVPGAEVGLAQLSRESDVYDRMYSYLLERQQQTAIIKASTLSKNRILDSPEVAVREDSPKLLLRLASLLLGLLLGVFCVLLRSFLASTFQTEADVRSIAAASPIFGKLPHRTSRRARKAGPGPHLDVLEGDMTSPFAEAFRVLRTNLYRWQADASGKLLLITSPNPGDGKTTCTLALAAMLAADGKRVLVVDADFRKPNLPPIGDREAWVPGLREVSRGQSNWGDGVSTVQLSEAQFYVLASGGQAPAELLSTPQMAEFLQDARARCDFVLLDVPSFPQVSDALVLSLSVDAVLSVFRLEHTSRKLAAEHLAGLSSAARAHAIVINDAGFDRTSTKAARGSEPVAKGGAFRGRLVWWLSGVILLVCGAALFGSRKHLPSNLLSVVELRQ